MNLTGKLQQEKKPLATGSLRRNLKSPLEHSELYSPSPQPEYTPKLPQQPRPESLPVGRLLSHRAQLGPEGPESDLRNRRLGAIVQPRVVTVSHGTIARS
jgi:hypothetical protein